MSRGDLSTFGYLPHSLSSEIWNSCHTGLLLAWLGLQDILYLYLLRVFNSLSFHLLLLWKTATDLFEVIFYPVTLLKVFMSCKFSLLEFLESLMSIIPSMSSDTLTSSFLICVHFVFFSCLIVLARTLSTRFNRYGRVAALSLNSRMSPILVQMT